MPYPMTIPQYSMLPTMMARGGYVNDAKAVQAQGRGKDTMLVHMTPKEVAGLQALARSRGGSLSINPDTGLPEAGFLDDLLPTIAGIALTVGSGGAIDPVTAGMIVGGAQTVRTGDLGKGLTAGLGAYGGAGLTGGLQSAGVAANASNAANVAGTETLTAAGSNALEAAAPTLTPTQQLTTGFKSVFDTGSTGQAARDAFMGKVGGYGGLAKTAGMAGAPIIADALTPKPYEFTSPKEESNYEGPYKPSERRVSYPGEEDRRRTSEFTYFSPSNPIPFAEGGETSASAPDIVVSPNEARVYQDIINVQRLAGLPALDPNRFFVTPGRSYEQYVYNPIEGAAPVGTTGEKDYGIKPLMSKADVEAALAKKNAEEGEEFAQGIGRDILKTVFNKGGSVPQLEDGGFVLTKKAVDGLGGGNNKRGQEVATRGLGAIPIKGPGTGTSDSIRTTIEGKQPARIANGESYVPRKEVSKRGGAKAFYALMNKAEKAADKRKRA